MVLTATFLPFTIRANRARSEYSPFVQVPTKTWSSGSPSSSWTGCTISTRGGTATSGTTSERSDLQFLCVRAGFRKLG